MNLPTVRTNYCCSIILFFGIICFGSPLQSTAATPLSSTKPEVLQSTAAPPSSSTKLEVLEAKVDLLQKTNERILQTVYWTLATIAAIFLGLISVNLYFNISANKREIDKIREESEALTKSLIQTAQQEISEKSNAVTQTEIARVKEEIANLTTSEVKTSEANLIEKTNAATQREIEKASANILNVAKNEILTHKAEITKLIENSTKILESTSSSVMRIEDKLPELEVRVREMEAYRFSKEGKMGAIIAQIELLEYDLEKRTWNLKFRLPKILEETKSTIIFPEQAEKLRGLLGKIKEEEHKNIIKKILASIQVEEREGESK